MMIGDKNFVFIKGLIVKFRYFVDYLNYFFKVWFDKIILVCFYYK